MWIAEFLYGLVREAIPKRCFQRNVSTTAINALLNITLLIVSWSGEADVSLPDAGFLLIEEVCWISVYTYLNQPIRVKHSSHNLQNQTNILGQ